MRFQETAEFRWTKKTEKQKRSLVYYSFIWKGKTKVFTKRSNIKTVSGSACSVTRSFHGICTVTKFVSNWFVKCKQAICYQVEWSAKSSRRETWFAQRYCNILFFFLFATLWWFVRGGIWYKKFLSSGTFPHCILGVSPCLVVVHVHVDDIKEATQKIDLQNTGSKEYRITLFAGSMLRIIGSRDVKKDSTPPFPMKVFKIGSVVLWIRQWWRYITKIISCCVNWVINDAVNLLWNRSCLDNKWSPDREVIRNKISSIIPKNVLELAGFMIHTK